MSNYYSTDQRSAIDRDNRQMHALGLAMSSELQAIRDLISAGSIGITATAADVDSIALDGGAFAVDTDNVSGLTWAHLGGRIWNGSAIVTVAADTLALTPSATNYVEVDQVGVVSANTSAFTAGRVPLYVITTNGSGITATANAKALLSVQGAGVVTTAALAAAAVTGAKLSTAAATKSIEIYLGDISATANFSVLLPAVAGTITAIALATKTAVAADDTDYWTFAAVNKGAAGTGTTALLAATDANTTKSTGGSAMTAYVARALTLHGTGANLVTAASDVLEVTITKSASATTMQQCVLRVDVQFTA